MTPRRRMSRAATWGWVVAAVLAWQPLAASAGSPVEAPVQVETGSGLLHGTLSTPPDATGPMPAVLIIAGSGPIDRDGNVRGFAGRNDSLRLLALALAERQVAAVRYDKRGIAASQDAGRPEEQMRIEDYADDACSWLAWMRQQTRLGPLAVIGHSEGALIGALAAQRCPQHLSAYVSLAGVGGRASDALRLQLQHPQVPERVRARSEVILQALERGETIDEVPPSLNALFRPSVQPYLVTWFRYDASAVLAKLAMPVMIVGGSTDIQVRPDEARTLAAARPDARLLIVEGMNHVLKTAPPGDAEQLPAYTNPELPVPAALTEPLSAFLHQHLRGGDRAGPSSP